MTYNPQQEMIRRMDACTFSMRIAEHENLAAWQNRARARLADRLGLPFEKVPAEAQVEWTRKEDSYTETRFVFKSEQDITVPCHLLVPAGAPHGKKFPLIICLQGHSKGMHISLGRPLYEGDEETIAGDRDFARQAVQRGYAALAIEQRGFGESGGTPEGPDCQQIAMQALLLGRTLIGERVWDVSRAIDVVGDLFSMIDMRRIAAMGNSGGGTTTIYAAAMDERIAAAMPSCAVSGFLPSIGAQHHCTCNYVPAIMKDFDMADLAGLVAPRPLVIVSGRDDGIFPIASAIQQYEIARDQYYARTGAQEAIRHVIGEGGHRFYAAEGWQAFDGITGWQRQKSCAALSATIA